MCRRIGFKLVHQRCETGKIIGDRGDLSDMEKLADQGLVLIAIETIVHQFAEVRPGQLRDLMLDRLVPKRGRTIKVHLRHANPHRLLNLIHTKVFLSTSFPTARVVTVEAREWNLRQAAKVRRTWWIRLRWTVWRVGEHGRLVGDARWIGWRWTRWRIGNIGGG
jgi:hypothetical protein